MLGREEIGDEDAGGDAAHLAQVPVRHRTRDARSCSDARGPLLNLLGDFIGELRAAGIPVSMSEHVDAARALEVIDLGDRALVRARSPPRW